MARAKADGGVVDLAHAESLTQERTRIVMRLLAIVVLFIEAAGAAVRPEEWKAINYAPRGHPYFRKFPKCCTTGTARTIRHIQHTRARESLPSFRAEAESKPEEEPFRAAGPRLDVEKVGEKTVVHNYGHGGSGWSLSWGSSSVAVEKAMAAGERDVAVIGCGTGVEVQLAGVQEGPFISHVADLQSVVPAQLP